MENTTGCVFTWSAVMSLPVMNCCLYFCCCSLKKVSKERPTYTELMVSVLSVLLLPLCNAVARPLDGELRPPLAAQ